MDANEKQGIFFLHSCHLFEFLQKSHLSVRTESLLQCMAKLTFCGDAFGEGSGSRREGANHTS